MKETKFWIIAALAMVCLLAGGMNVNAADKSLTARQEAIIPIAAFAATGNTQQLLTALEAGLKAGLTVNEIREELIQIYAYAGFPRSLTALNVFMNLLEERKKQGINDALGPEPAAVAKDTDRNALGTRIQTELTGAPVKGALFEFAPAIDAFLKEHLFCDIFSRGVLSNQDRELTTISALAALPAPDQLRAHLRISLHTGITPHELEQYIDVLKNQVGDKPAELARTALAEVLGQSR